MVRIVRTLLVAMLLGLVLAGCGAPGFSSSTPTPQPSPTSPPTPTARPTATPAPTATIAPTATAEPTEEPTEEPQTQPQADLPQGFELYTSEEGQFSIGYPSDWSVNEDGETIQFQPSSREALIQVNYADLGGELDHEELVNIASEGFAQGFGESYVEEDRVPQADGSTRIDFALEEDPRLVGSAFVEQRGTVFYILMVMAQEDTLESYGTIFEQAILSYTLPGQGAAEEAAEGEGPEQRVTSFFDDFGRAISDPDIDDEAVQASWARQLASYLPPDDREAGEEEILSAISELGTALGELKATGADIQLQASIADLETELVEEQGDTATVRVVNGVLRLEFAGNDAEIIPEDQRVQEQPLSELFEQGSNEIEMVQIDDVWYISSEL